MTNFLLISFRFLRNQIVGRLSFGAPRFLLSRFNFDSVTSVTHLFLFIIFKSKMEFVLPLCPRIDLIFSGYKKGH